MAIAKKDYLTKEQVEAAMAQGLNTYEALGAALNRGPKAMKTIMDGFGMTLEQLPEIITPALSPVEVDTNDGTALYNQYHDNTQAQFLIAECKVKRNMTATQAAQGMKDNFVYRTENFVWETFREAQEKIRLERKGIKQSRQLGVGTVTCEE